MKKRDSCERPMSPDEAHVACPDCGDILTVRMTFLANNGNAVHVATCPTCADHITVKAHVVLTPDEFKAWYMAGVPVMHYERA